jgi:hypothetical protein
LEKNETRVELGVQKFELKNCWLKIELNLVAEQMNGWMG